MLLIITESPDVLQALRDAEVAFIAVTDPEAAEALLVEDPALEHALIAYGSDYAAKPDARPVTSETLLAGILIHPGDGDGIPWTGAVKLSVQHAIALPLATPWLRRQLRLLAAAHRTVRADLAGVQA